MNIFRYITVLYYLNDPEEGGETAFPLADMPEELVDVSMTRRSALRRSLTTILPVGVWLNDNQIHTMLSH